MVASLLVAIGVAAWIVIKQLPDLITVEYETNHYESSDTFERIYLVADEVDVSFAVSPDGICRVECYEPSKDTHKVTMKGGSLLLQKESKKAWYEPIGNAEDHGISAVGGLQYIFRGEKRRKAYGAEGVVFQNGGDRPACGGHFLFGYGRI